MPRVLPILLTVAITAVAASSASAQQDLSDVEITTIPLTAGLFMLSGAGGNIGVSVAMAYSSSMTSSRRSARRS